MRRLRIAAPAQLRLGIAGIVMNPSERWWQFPPHSQQAAVAILARMIATSVVEEQPVERGPDATDE